MEVYEGFRDSINLSELSLRCLREQGMLRGSQQANVISNAPRMAQRSYRNVGFSGSISTGLHQGKGKGSRVQEVPWHLWGWSTLPAFCWPHGELRQGCSTQQVGKKRRSLALSAARRAGNGHTACGTRAQTPSRQSWALSLHLCPLFSH